MRNVLSQHTSFSLLPRQSLEDTGCRPPAPLPQSSSLFLSDYIGVPAPCHGHFQREENAEVQQTRGHQTIDATDKACGLLLAIVKDHICKATARRKLEENIALVVHLLTL